MTDDEIKTMLIRKIKDVSDAYGDKLVELMDEAHVWRLPDVTTEQVARYCVTHDID